MRVDWCESEFKMKIYLFLIKREFGRRLLLALSE